MIGVVLSGAALSTVVVISAFAAVDWVNRRFAGNDTAIVCAAVVITNAMFAAIVSGAIIISRLFV